MRKNLLKAAGIIFIVGAVPALLRSSVRTVSVKLIADEEFRTTGRAWPGDWSHDLRRELAAISAEFEERFGLRFAIAATGGWMSDNRRHSLPGLIGDLYPDLLKSRADILVGFTAQGTISDRFAGCSSFDHCIVLVRRMSTEAAMGNVLKHELCHIFGAVDIEESGSVMDRADRVKGDGFDEFTTGLILLHKDRELGERAGLRPGPELDAALSLCLERHAAKPAEISIQELMAHYYHTRKDYAALKRVSEELLSRNPDLPEIHNFLGIACSFFGEDARATGEFEAAVRLHPDFPEAYLNLALCRIEAGDPAQAEDCYRQALRIVPGCCEAHKFLGRLLESGNRTAEAVGHYKMAVSIDPRLGEELMPRIKKLS